MFFAGERLRLKTPTIAIAPDDQGKQTSVMVPSGDVVVLVENVDEGDLLVRVDWRGTIYQMFSVDLRERGEITKDSTA